MDTLEIPHLELLKELYNSAEPISDVIDSLHAHLFTLNSSYKKVENLKPTGFFFTIHNTWSLENQANIITDLYKNVSYTLVVLSQLESNKNDFKKIQPLYSFIVTVTALKSNINNIESIINNFREKEPLTFSKPVCKKLFLYTESIRALLEEIYNIKGILLDRILEKKHIFLTKEPLDLKEDLE